LLDLKNIRTVYFLGIGGIGMSALARYFQFQGCKVYGYDKIASALTNALEKEGIVIRFDEDITKIPETTDLVVLTPAIPNDNTLLQYFIKNNTPIKKRAEVLGLIAREGLNIAVAGTHGKTTVTTLISHLLKQSIVDCTAFLGGISKNYNTNLLLSTYSKYIVAEADEYDRSFLQLFPHIAIITSIDADHLDIYGSKASLEDSFCKFALQVQEKGYLIVNMKINIPFNLDKNAKVYQYSLQDEKADFYASGIQMNKGLYSFDFHYPDGVITDLRLGLPGLFNVENAVAALAATWLCKVQSSELRKALLTFSGVKRRFDYRFKSPECVYIDDYAHHPEELKTCISSIRNLYPGKKIMGIFQPHLFSRTRDFAEEFARSLELLDKIILLDIYPAREKPIEGITSQFLLDKIEKKEKKLCTKENVLDEIENNLPEIIVTLGAGDIDRLVEPIVNMLNKRINTQDHEN